MVTAAQLRAARGLLNISVAELAEQTGLAVNTIRKAESDGEAALVRVATMQLLTRTLETAGVVFVDADALGPGVRLAASTSAKKPNRRRRKSGA